MQRSDGLRACLVAGLLALGLAVPAAHGVTIDWVTVGDPGNPADFWGPGAVDHVYRIMRFEWTNSQYVAFLNAIDPDGTNPNAVYDDAMGSSVRGGITRSGTVHGSRYAVRAHMGTKPVNFVSWFDAARVANWLHNGAPVQGSTDASALAPQNVGAYALGTATSGDTVMRNGGARFWIPTENEWHKAAFYNPTLNGGAGGYTVYATGFSAAPTPVTADASGNGSAGPTGNSANFGSQAGWNGVVGNVTTVGTNGAPSFYGTFDQNGNVYEWHQYRLDSVIVNVGFKGGGFSTQESTVWVLSNATQGAGVPDSGYDDFGFRLVSAVPVPEPATWALGVGALAWVGLTRRHQWRARSWVRRPVG